MELADHKMISISEIITIMITITMTMIMIHMRGKRTR
jgi:hypothetical protein